MGVDRFLTSVRRLATAVRRSESLGERTSGNSGSTRSAGSYLDVDPAAAARRTKERARFADDAAYFEFLIERAIADGTKTT